MERSPEVQTALYNRLIGDAPLMAVITGVYDDVPQEGATCPYVVIGDSTVNEADTQTYTAMDNTINIHTWSLYSGRLQTKQIMQLIYECLHRKPLVLTDGTNWELIFDFSDDFMDDDGETRHGVQRFKIMTVR